MYIGRLIYVRFRSPKSSGAPTSPDPRPTRDKTISALFFPFIHKTWEFSDETYLKKPISYRSPATPSIRIAISPRSLIRRSSQSLSHKDIHVFRNDRIRILSDFRLLALKVVMQQLRQELLRDGRFARLDVARTVIGDDFREDVVRLL